MFQNMNRYRRNRRRIREPSWIVAEEKCDIYFNENNANGFMIKFIKKLFTKPELLLSYECLDRERLEEAKRVYLHYYKTENGGDYGMARDAVKRALSKCRFFRRQKIYQSGQRYTCITSENDKFYYFPQDAWPYRLIPYSDPELETRMDTRNTYFVDDDLKIPTIYRKSEYLILIKKTEKKIKILRLHPHPDPAVGFMDIIFQRTINREF